MGQSERFNSLCKKTLYIRNVSSYKQEVARETKPPESKAHGNRPERVPAYGEVI